MVSFEPGKVFAGRYRVERVLGQGGMGVVLAAWHLDLDRRVALKLLRAPNALAPGVAERLMREGRAAAKLGSEHVPRVLDVGKLDDGTPYLVLEYVHGTNLSALLGERGPLPVADAVDYVLQVCEALVEAHKLGIVHRDLKPSNLMLTERADGSPLIKVLDFGIAKTLHHGGMSLTDSAHLLGSPAYMSPEQTRDARDVDPLTDIWSLGVTLYELCTDQLPFGATTVPALLAQIAADQPPPLRKHRPDLPPALEEVVLGCLAKAPEQRPSGVVELASRLSPFASERGRRTAQSVAAAAERPSASFRHSLPSLTEGSLAAAPPFAADNRPTASGHAVPPLHLAQTVLESTAALPAPARPRRAVTLGAALAGVCVLAVGVARLSPASPSADAAVASSRLLSAPSSGMQATAMQAASRAPAPDASAVDRAAAQATQAAQAVPAVPAAASSVAAASASQAATQPAPPTTARPAGASAPQASSPRAGAAPRGVTESPRPTSPPPPRPPADDDDLGPRR